MPQGRSSLSSAIAPTSLPERHPKSHSRKPKFCGKRIGWKRLEKKGGRLPIPTFSHREPPFCVAAEAYLFLAPFLAAAFFAPPLAAFFAPPFFAVAISLLLLSSKVFTSYTRYCSLATLVY